MKRVAVRVIAPYKLRSICEELSKVRDYCGTSIYIHVGYSSDIAEFEKVLPEGLLACDCLLVFDTAAEAVSVERAYEKLLQTLKQIRLRQLQLRIILVLGKETETNGHLINELIKIGIYNLYFVDAFNLDDVVSWILGSEKGLGDVEQYITQTITKTVEQKIVERIVEVPVEVPVPAPIQEEKRKPLRLPFLSRSEQPKEERIRSPGACVVGVLGAAYGVGTTSCCIELAKSFKKEGNKTALIERNQSQQLQRWPEREAALKGITFYEDVPFRTCYREYDWIIVDYGPYLELSPGGEYVTKVLDDSAKSKMAELLFCDRVVLVASPSPWRAYEPRFYCQDKSIAEQTTNWIFYLPDWADPGEITDERLAAFGTKEEALQRLQKELKHVAR